MSSQPSLGPLPISRAAQERENGETGGKKATMCLQLQPCPRWEHGSGHKHLPPLTLLDLNQKCTRNLYLQSQDLLKLIPHYSTPLTILAPVLRTLSADRQQKAWLQRASASTKLAWSPRQPRQGTGPSRSSARRRTGALRILVPVGLSLLPGVKSFLSG